MRIYFDNNATTRLDPRVRMAMEPFCEGIYGNPSSIHAEGRRARDAVESARQSVAELVGGKPHEVIFTSGGTEGNFLAVVAAARAAREAGRPARVVTSPLEHPSVHGALAFLREEGFEIRVVPVDGAGRVDPEVVEAFLQGGAALVSLSLANHELGNICGIAVIAERARRTGVVFHSDAVQAVGKIDVDVGRLGVDLLSLSAHKLHGPKGVGALWVREGLRLNPVFRGGGQEKGLRPGTENVMGVVGLGEAARFARKEWREESSRIASLRDELERRAQAIPGARVEGDVDSRLANTTSVAFAGAQGELIVGALDMEGVCASTGAACSSGNVEPSPVMLAVGRTRDEAKEAIRFSLGKFNTLDEVTLVGRLLGDVVKRVRDAGQE